MALFDPQNTRTRVANPLTTGTTDLFQQTASPKFQDDPMAGGSYQVPKLPKVADDNAFTYPGQPSIGAGYDASQFAPGAPGLYHPTNESDNPFDSTPQQPAASAYPAQGGSTDRSGAIAQFYRTALGREGSQQEIAAWANGGMDLGAIQQAIYGSDEAKAYGSKQTGGATSPATGGTWQDWVNEAYQRTRGRAPSADELATWQGYWDAWGSKDPVYFRDRLDHPEKYGGGSDGRSGGGVFSDPATAEWEQALRAIVAKLNQPYDNPDLNPLLDYLRKYATQLQGPAYTPQQMDTLQTQALDPLTSQRDAMRQQILQRASQRGLDPSSGIVQDEINQLDRSLSQQRSQRQGQFAANAVNLDRQNQQLSGQVLAQIAALQEQNFQGNENRALQALQLLQQIPQYADKRLQLALSSMQGNQTNPASLMSLLNSFQNSGLTNQNMDANYWAQIGQAIMKVIGGL